jgi:hypothetical protein
MNCVYVSNLTIPDRGLLAALCLIHDQVLLPHPYELDSAAKPLMRGSMSYMDDLEISQRYYANWISAHRELFDAMAMAVLPPPLDVGDAPGDLDQQLLDKLGRKVPKFGREDVLSGRLAIAMHALFARTPDLDFVLARPGDTSTSHLQTILARETLVRRVPHLPELVPEQIVELREITAPFKEGFHAYLSSLVDDVESRLGSTGGDEQEAASRTFARKIDHELKEHARQELPKKVEWWAKVAQRITGGVARVIGIVTTPWSASNYPELAGDAAGLIELGASGAVERASNPNQAFQFLGRIETATRK